MKAIIQVLFVFCTLNGFAQFIPVLSSDKTVYPVQIEVFDGTITGVIQVEGDTMVAQTLRKKVFLSSEFEPEPQLVGYVHEDSQTGALFFYNQFERSQSTVFNMSLSIGDSITFRKNGCGDFQNNATHAKEINVKQNEGRKEIIFDWTFGGGIICDTLKFIEGVGPNASLFWLVKPEFPFIGFAYKVCRMMKEDTLAYPLSGNVDFCEESTSIPTFILAHDVLIYPNPIDDIINLEFEKPFTKAVTFQVYDALGRKVLSRFLDVSSGKCSVSMKAYNTGMYYYSLSIEGSIIKSGKLLKARL